jgi:hypothetical protein
VLDKVVEALQAAGATEEMIAAAVGAAGEFGDSPPRPNGRPRKYADRALRDRAYRERKKARDEMRDETPPRDVIRDEIQAPRDEMRDVIPVGVDPWADISPIRAPLEQGCGSGRGAREAGATQTSTASLLPGTHGRGMAGRCKSRDVAGAPDLCRITVAW